jgi:plastocyanin
MVQYVKKQIKTPGGKFVAFIFLSALLLVGWVNSDASSTGKMPEDNIREIVLEIRNMAFGDNNPTLYLKPKETVRFVILNLDTGMKHNFLIQETAVATKILDYGEKEAVLFTVPSEEGELDYLCSLHALMMRGRLVIGDVRFSKNEP